MSTLTAFASSRQRVDGARLLMNLPAHTPAAAILPVVTRKPALPSRPTQVLQSRSAPAQLSLFPPPGMATMRGKR
jgi:hypothetical protein